MTGLVRWATLILALMLISCGCKDPPLQRISTSPDGRFAIMRDVFGHCGGVPVGYRSALVLVDTTRNRWRRSTTLVYLRGLPRPVIRWVSPRAVEIELYMLEAEKLKRSFQNHNEVEISIRERREDANVPHRIEATGSECCERQQ
jgi:hypothetical protein